MKTVHYIKEGAHALISIRCPQSKYTANENIAIEIRSICKQIQEDEHVRVVILTSDGQGFSFPRNTYVPVHDDHTVDPISDWLDHNKAASSLAALKIPVIASVNGNALNHGLELILACDIRIVEDQVCMGFTDISDGVIPWDGGTQRLSRIIGRGKALELLLTNRIINAREAIKIGLVTEIAKKTEGLEVARKYASRIANGPPIATRFLKEAIYKGLDLGLTPGLELEADLSAMLLDTTDREEGLKAFFEKRDPKFRNA